MSTKPEMTDAEILPYMDFDSVLRKKRAADARTAANRKLRNGSLMALGLLVLTTFIYQVSKQMEVPAHEVASLPQEKKGSETRPSTAVEGTDASAEPTKDDKLKDDLKLMNAPAKGTSEQKKPAMATPPDSTMEDLYQQAEPVDGFPHLYDYFAQNLTYPVEALQDSIEGIVTVHFILNASGQPGKIEVDHSLGTPFDQEAIRIIENMPPWHPATLNGKAVPSKISLPLTFQISREKRK